MEINELITDSEIQSAMPCLREEEFQQLEQNILNDGKVTDPIIVWETKIVDGEHRARVLREHPEIPFSVEYMDFPDEDAAVAWACLHQAGRRNLRRQEINIIVGTASICAKRSIGGDRGTAHDPETGEFVTASGQIDPMRSDADKSGHITRDETAEAFGVTPSFVRHAEDITKAVDLADEAVPGFKEAYKTGNIKMSDDFIKKAMKVPEKDRAEVAEAILDVNKNNTDEKNRENKEWAQKLVEQHSNPDVGIDNNKSLRSDDESTNRSENAAPEFIPEEQRRETDAETFKRLFSNEIEMLDISLFDLLDFSRQSPERAETLRTPEGKEISEKGIASMKEILEKYERLIESTRWT